MMLNVHSAQVMRPLQGAPLSYLQTSSLAGLACGGAIGPPGGRRGAGMRCSKPVPENVLVTGIFSKGFP